MKKAKLKINYQGVPKGTVLTLSDGKYRDTNNYHIFSEKEVNSEKDIFEIIEDFKVGDWIKVLDKSSNDTMHTEFKKCANKDDILQIHHLSKCSHSDYKVAVTEQGHVLYIEEYPQDFCKATLKEIMELFKKGDIIFHKCLDFSYLVEFSHIDCNRIKGDAYINIEFSEYGVGYANSTITELRFATAEEKDWLQRCKKANKFVAKKQAKFTTADGVDKYDGDLFYWFLEDTTLITKLQVRYGTNNEDNHKAFHSLQNAQQYCAEQIAAKRGIKIGDIVFGIYTKDSYRVDKIYSNGNDMGVEENGYTKNPFSDILTIEELAKEEGIEIGMRFNVKLLDKYTKNYNLHYSFYSDNEVDYFDICDWEHKEFAILLNKPCFVICGAYLPIIGFKKFKEEFESKNKPLFLGKYEVSFPVREEELTVSISEGYLIVESFLNWFDYLEYLLSIERTRNSINLTIDKFTTITDKDTGVTAIGCVQNITWDELKAVYNKVKELLDK
jgi:hypothetical protein